jgi:hypothetical protein
VRSVSGKLARLRRHSDVCHHSAVAAARGAVTIEGCPIVSGAPPGSSHLGETQVTGLVVESLT